MVSLQDTAVERSSASAEPGVPRRRTLVVLVVLVVVAVVLAMVAAGVMAAHAGPPGPPAASVGTAFVRVVPQSVADIPLVDQTGVTTSLAAERGKVVVLVPFLTSCQEVCPITTGALLQVQRSLGAAGVQGKVAILEVSVDPGRDTPGRLAAYAHLTGARWPLLTGTTASLDALWKFFAVDHTIVPEDSPPGIDWQTGRPYTYDVDHSDGFMLLDAPGNERFAGGGMPRTTAPLPPVLGSMLDAQGRSNLASPGAGSWSEADVLDGVGWLLDRHVSSGG